MKKSSLVLSVVLLGALIAGCSGQAGGEGSPSPTPEVIITSETAVDSPVGESAGPPAPATCQPNPPQPTPNPQDLANFTPDPENDWILGAENPTITLIEYADFQCPYCSVASVNLKALLEKYPDDVQIVYRHFPLASIHDKAIPATQAAEAAGLQGDDFFWAMHDLLYQTQAEWSGLSLDEFDSWIYDRALELGLDGEQFAADYQSEEIVAFSQATWTDGQALGIPGTPYIKLNSLYDVQPDPATLTAYVELIKLEELQFTACPPMSIEQDGDYRAVVETEGGEFVIELFAEAAPLAVNNFIFLAENGWFDGVTFHRVLPGFVAQTGDPTGTGFGNPGYRFGNEIKSDLVFDREGLVAMANSGPDSNGSQFFITYDAAPSLNGGYTIFGEVVEGMEVVNSITPRDPQQGQELPPGDLIIRVTIEQQ